MTLGGATPRYSTASDRGTLIALALTLAISGALGMWLAGNRLTDPFLYFDIAFLESLQGQTRMVVPETGQFASLSLAPGRQALLAQLVGMMGIEATTLQFFPLGSLIVAASAFMLALRVLGAPSLAALASLSLMLNLSHAAALYSVFSYALALPLFFGFVVLALAYFRRPSPGGVFLLLMLFVAAQLVHYTIAVWFILFLLGSGVALALQRLVIRNRSATSLRPATFLLLAMAAAFLWFNDTIYKSFLPLIGPEALEGALNRFLGFLSLAPAAAVPFVYDRPIDLGVITALPLALLAILVTIGLVAALYSISRHGADRVRSLRLMTLAGVAVLTIVDVMAYAVRGSISTKAVSILFPPFAIDAARRLGMRSGTAVGIALLMLSVLKASVFYSQGYVVAPNPTSSSSQQIKMSSEWLWRKAGQHESISMLADLNLYGKYLLAAQSHRDQISLNGFTVPSYSWLVGERSLYAEVDPPDLIAVDLRSSEPTTGFLWILLDPLRDHEAAMRSNREIHWIYDDSIILLGRPAQ